MLQNILLKAGEWNSIAKQGKFINVVLAAGDISARITKLNNQTFETKLVSGMAFPIPDGFQSVAFLSDVSQQTKVWLGDLPLTYSPIESKTVGSSTLNSTVKEAYSGQANILLPAKMGRNKITISPEKPIKVGGVGVTTSSGIKIAAGEVFSLQTQGAVYAIEDSGGYPMRYTATLTDGDIAVPLSAGPSLKNGLAVSPDGKTLFSVSSGGTSVYMYDAETMESKGSVAGFGTVVGYAVTVIGDDIVWSATGSGAPWYTLNMITLEHGYEVVNSVTNSRAEHSAARGGTRFCVDGFFNAMVDVGGGWTTNVITGAFGNIYGCDIDVNGDLYAVTQTQLCKSIDDGVTWQITPLPKNSTGEHALSIDESDGKMYLVTTSGLYSSIDGGATFAIEVGGAGMNAVEASFGTVVVTNSNHINFKFGDGEWVSYVKYLQQVRGLCIGKGRVFVGTSNSGMLVFSGEPVAVGGLKVAVMEEVN